jgi:hypothetical protein
VAAAAGAGASGRLLQLTALVLPLLHRYLHLLLGEAFLGLEACAEGRIAIAELGHAVALLGLEALSPSFLQYIG